MELATNHLEKRCNSPITSSIKLAIDLIGFKPKNVTIKRSMPEISVNSKRRRCDHLYSYKGSQSKDNKKNGVCDHCLKPTCPLHYVRSCESCYLLNYKDPDTLEESREEEEDDDYVDEEEAGPSTSNASKRQKRFQPVINL